MINVLHNAKSGNLNTTNSMFNIRILIIIPFKLKMLNLKPEFENYRKNKDKCNQ